MTRSCFSALSYFLYKCIIYNKQYTQPYMKPYFVYSCSFIVPSFLLYIRMFLLRPIVNIQHFGEAPWPRGSMLDLRQTILQVFVLTQRKNTIVSVCQHIQDSNWESCRRVSCTTEKIKLKSALEVMLRLVGQRRNLYVSTIRFIRRHVWLIYQEGRERYLDYVFCDLCGKYWGQHDLAVLNISLFMQKKKE